jgi:hypothetical protein
MTEGCQLANDAKHGLVTARHYGIRRQGRDSGAVDIRALIARAE